MPSTHADASLIASVQRFMSGCSFEATRPKRQEIEALGKTLPKDALLFLTALPGRPVSELETAAALARENGISPVPHISARRCGVKASAEALAARSGLVRHAFRPMTPDLIIRTLAEALDAGRIENVQPHLFAFGGIEETAIWARGPITGAIKLNSDGGFDAL